MKLLFVVACLVAVAVAVPAATKEKETQPKTRTGKVLDDHVETGVAARWDKTKPKQDAKVVPQKEQGPFLYFREPRAHGYVAQSDIQIDGAWAPVRKNWVGPRYRINKARDDEEDDTDSDEDEQDDVDFQDEGSEEEGSFDTPSWDYLFPKSQTGQYARRQPPKNYGQGPSTYKEHGHSPPVQDAENSGYSLAVGSPGSSAWRGRSSHGPWARPNKWSGKQTRYWSPVRGSKSYGRPERVPQSWYQGEQGPVAYASAGAYPYGGEQWIQRQRPVREREVYYQSQGQYGPSPVRRRNWNNGPAFWGPRPKKVWASAPVSAESDEEEEGPWGVQPQGPRRIKNWSKPQPWAYGQGRRQKFAYY